MSQCVALCSRSLFEYVVLHGREHVGNVRYALSQGGVLKYIYGLRQGVVLKYI